MIQNEVKEGRIQDSKSAQLSWSERPLGGGTKNRHWIRHPDAIVFNMT